MDFEHGVRKLRDDIRKETGFYKLYIKAPELSDEQAQREKWGILSSAFVLLIIGYVVIGFWLWPSLHNNVIYNFHIGIKLIVIGALVIIPLKIARGFIEKKINHVYQRALKNKIKVSHDSSFPEHIFERGRKRWNKWVRDNSLSIEDIKERAFPYVELEVERGEKSTWRGFLGKIMPGMVVGIPLAVFAFFTTSVIADFQIEVQMAMLPEEELKQLLRDTGRKVTTKKDFIAGLDVDKPMSKAFDGFLLVAVVMVIVGHMFNASLYDFRPGSKINATILLRAVIETYLKEHSGEGREVQIFSHDGRVLSSVMERTSHRQD
ncbi:hypothetical protein [Shouchella lonarensis]|uniref:Uncharacterized protein n=1 Tax=Shouchella lonarensis TaxID=1464122 RepID=A0A1G6HMM5_9BACI|nr:hypothetical protein [Shouchella lonarensis]SDB95135.1 hypothetical protein SAMN05421737_10464 [Shouchella lonarensis]